MFTVEQINDLLVFTHELPNVECKGPGKLSDNPLFGKVVRAAIGMANRRGGGIVIVGIAERNHILCPDGLTDEQMATWRYEDIADGINQHADPPIFFEYQPCEWGGKKFLILHIYEFTDVPIICKKEYRDDSNQQVPPDKRKKVLKKGCLYARSHNKPETKEIDSVEPMRALLNPAIDKGIDRFVKQLQIASIPSEEKKREERKQRLQALLADHRGFLHDRLDSFVGREAELVQIRQRIAEMMSTGGYVTITGQAGQGKSSIIAKLVDEYGEEQVAYHFIPFNPGPDHQVGLLRNLMARFILKYDLTDLYVASESRPALRDYFPKVLAEVVAQERQEVIFLDGLDQLEEDMIGVRDLSFLPDNPPPGIVFVLGSRPNDALKPLGSLKHHLEYQLPGLNRQDFDRILKRRGVSLDPQMADQFHQKLQENALYLDLVAQELQENETIPLQEMITRLAHNPANLFSFAIERLSRHRKEWKRVIRPVLGALLAAREPLTFEALRHILHLEPDSLRKALTRLGGLIADIRQLGEQRYTLFHLKFRDYLKQDKQNPGKEYIFANDEEEQWHAVIATWCEQGQLSQIWQETKDVVEQGRREYTRRHYAAHLYYARRWQHLFDLLDEGSYGQAKEHYDVSTRSYVQDLDFGRQAAARNEGTLEEGLALLSQLWRFTLLRGSLRSR
ncbi:MAG TPA: AAA family ATPase, partial [Ktedonobacteraceae bacterium]|nr:AAA family ATPase [Ktedonobacteraceae bacterium]